MILKLVKKLDELIAKDKLFHFVFGELIFALFSSFGIIHGLFAVAIIGIAKEMLDHFYGGTVSFGNFVATVLGGAVCAIPLFIVGSVVL